MSELLAQGDLAADSRVAELIAIAAAVGSNCEACFRSHYQMARNAGVSDSEIVAAVSIAHAVKETPARRMLELAARKLDVPTTTFAPAGADPAGAHANEAEDCGCGDPESTEGAAPAASASCC